MGGSREQMVVVWVKFTVFPPFFGVLEPASSMCLEQHDQKGLLTSAARSKLIKAHKPPFSGVVQCDVDLHGPHSLILNY